MYRRMLYQSLSRCASQSRTSTIRNSSTQAQQLTTTFNTPTIQFFTPSVLTSSAPSHKPANAADCMSRGALLPDNFVCNLLETRLSRPDCQQHGWVLDGFPRTPTQAQHLLHISRCAPPQVMIELVVSTKELETRLSNRLHDPVTNVTYGASSAIPQSDTVRARLKRRSDDDHTVVQTRLRTYEREMPLVRRVFKDAGVPIVRVCGGGRDVDDVCEGVREAVGGRTRVVMAGAPGCGKGTQGGLLAQLEGPIHVSTSDLLRGNEH